MDSISAAWAPGARELGIRPDDNWSRNVPLMSERQLNPDNDQSPEVARLGPESPASSLWENQFSNLAWPDQERGELCIG